MKQYAAHTIKGSLPPPPPLGTAAQFGGEKYDAKKSRKKAKDEGDDDMDVDENDNDDDNDENDNEEKANKMDIDEGMFPNHPCFCSCTNHPAPFSHGL